MLVPLSDPESLLLKLIVPSTAAGFGPRWRTLLNDGLIDGALCRTRLGERTGKVLFAASFAVLLALALATLLAVPFLTNPSLRAPADCSEAGR